MLPLCVTAALLAVGAAYPQLLDSARPLDAVLLDSAPDVPLSSARADSPLDSPAFRLGAGWDGVLGRQLDYQFSCEGRGYGYFADSANDCQLFHVCMPVVDFDGQENSLQFSFFCGNQTVFDQASLTCTYVDEALDCAQAESFYASSNDQFFRTTGSSVQGQGGSGSGSSSGIGSSGASASIINLAVRKPDS